MMYGIVCFLIEWYLLKHTYCYSYEGNYCYGNKKRRTELKKLPVKVWHIICLALLALIPVINLIGFSMFIGYYIVACVDIEHSIYETYWVPKDRVCMLVYKLVRKLYSFMNKSI